MFKRSTWLHLRIPFSFFLLPVFLFALALSTTSNVGRTLIVFIILHIFIYPASNGFNSYFDKDEKSIGGLKNPPQVSKGLYRMALLFDVIGIFLGLQIGWEFAVMLFIYGLVSKAYSHPSIRIKKFPFASWIIAGFFQGAFTFVMAFMALNGYELGQVLNPPVLIPAFLSSALLWGSYPMTQIYQHEEDKKRGDITLSYLLGVKGTFYFTGLVFTLSSFLYFLYFLEYHQLNVGIVFLVAMFPIVSYFILWFFKVNRNSELADFSHTMRLNFISAIFLNLFFAILYLQTHQYITL